MVRKRKVLFCFPSCVSGGTTVALIDLLTELVKEPNLQIDLFLIKKHGEFLNKIPKEVNVYESRGIWQTYTVTKEQSKNFSKWFRFKYLLFRIWNKVFTTSFLSKFVIHFQKKFKNYDVAICYDHDIKVKTGLDDFILRKVKARKKIMYVHTDFLKCNLGTPQNLKRDIKFDKIVTISKSLENQIAENFPQLKEKLITINNLINTDKILELSRQDQQSVKFQTTYNLISVGRITQPKGYDRAIEIAKYLKSKNLEFMWNIVGDGEYLATLKNDVKNNDLENNFNFLGFQSNPYKFVKKSDLFILLSYHESYGIVLVESMVCGVPVVTPNTLSAEEIVKDFGFVTPNDTNSLKQQIEYCIVNKSEIELKKEKLKNYSYNNSKIIEKTLKLFDN